MKVLVIDAGTLHTGYLGCYGNEWVETPHLDRLAAEGVVFDQHYADCPGAEGDSRTCRTGRFDFPMPGFDAKPQAAEIPSLPRLLAAHRIGNWLVSPAEAGPATLLDGAVDAALAMLPRLADRADALLWLDLPPQVPPWQVPEEFLERYFAEGPEEEAEPLAPWADPPAGPLDPADETDRERLQNTYAAAVTYLDAQVGRLLEALDDTAWGGEALVCFTADRGLALGEHGVVGACRPWLHEEVLHLPLIVRLPGRAEAGRRVFGLTQPGDLYATLLEAFGLPVPDAVHGRSVWPLLRGQSEEVRAYACGGLEVGGAIEWALRTPEWGFILPVSSAAEDRSNNPQLYVKPDDRWEVNNVVQHHLDLAEYLEQTLRGFVEAGRRPGPLEPPPLRDVEAEKAEVESHGPDPSANPGGESGVPEQVP